MRKGSTVQEKQQKDVLFIWHAPARPFKRRDKSFFQTIGALVFLLIVILFFIREWLIIGVALSVMFVSYVLAAVPPGEIKYQITKKGIWIDELFYRFSELSEYWFENHLGMGVVVVTVPLRRIERILLVIHAADKNHIDELLRERLVFREKPLKTAIDTAAEWIRHKIPLEEEKASHRPT